MVILSGLMSILFYITITRQQLRALNDAITIKIGPYILRPLII
jgi:hypothetical protein